MQRSIILGGIVAVGCGVALACGSDDDNQIVGPVGDASMEAAADSAAGDGGGSGGTAGRGGSGGIAGLGGVAGTGGVAGAGGTPPAMCTPVELVCDGAEDCPMGQICCGRVELAAATPAYAEFACQDTCEFTMMGGWIELCHAGDMCANMETCEQTAVLPTSLSRCLTMNSAGAPRTDVSTAANEVNCGDTVCAANEKCCLRQPDVPYCAPATEACACMPGAGEAGAPEAGAGEAGVTDAGGPTRGGGNKDGGNQGGGQRDR